MAIYRRTPRNYNGTAVTTHQMVDLIPHFLSELGKVYQDRPGLILAAWPEIIGKNLASMTQAVSFVEGILVVKVRNSTLHSLLSQRDKSQLLQLLRQKFPRVTINNIHFRIG